jgi:hypothetical protein
MEIMKKDNEIKMKKTCMILFFIFFAGCSFISTSNSQNLLIKEVRFQGKVKIGMTREQVKENWGMPDSVIKKQGKDFDEIWIYVPHWKFKNYLYFRNGVLIKGDPDPEDLV